MVANGDTVIWREHMTDTAAAGVISILFGPGVGDSTANVGGPPPDAYWWIVKAQHYFAAPVKLN